MERTADFSPEDFAQFVIKTMDDPTKGQIYDALTENKVPDEEALGALQSVKNWTDSTDVDSVENPDQVLQQGSDPDDNMKRQDKEQQEGLTLEDLVEDADGLTGDDHPVDEEDDEGIIIPDEDDPDHRLPDEFDKRDGDVLDEGSIDEATRVGEDVNMSGEDMFDAILDYRDSNPDSTDADLERYLQTLGVPGDKLRTFMKELQRTLVSRRIAHMIFSTDISYSDAAKWAAENTDKKADEIKQVLIEAGATERQAQDAIAEIPPVAPGDPSMDPSDPSGGGDPSMGMDPSMGGPPGDPSLGETDPTGDADQSAGVGDDPNAAVDPNDPTAQEQPAEDDGLDAVADQYIENNPDIQRNGLMEILTGEGASPERAAELADAKLGDEQEEEFDPQVEDRVRTPRGAARVAHIHETLNGDVYTVEMEDGTREYFGINALSVYQEEKTSSTDVWGRIKSHMEENWYTDLDRLPRGSKQSYEKRVVQTHALREEIKGLIKDASPDEQLDLARIESALENEECYCQDKLKTSFDMGEAEYLTKQPQWNVQSSRTNQRFGPGGGTFHQAAIDAAQEIESIDWKGEVTAGADLFVEDIEPKYIADAGEVRRRAARYIEAKVAVIPEEKAKPIVSQFMANVEKARKSAAIQVRKTAGTQKEASVELPDNFEEGLFY